MADLSKEEKITLVKSRLSTLELDLSEEQLDFILHPINEACYLKACPGSGKTEVVGIKAAYEISKWKEKFAGIAILSFTKNAAKEISHRIQKHGGTNSTKHPHFVGTIDSWLHGYILQPFGSKIYGYNGKEGDKSYAVIESAKTTGFLQNKDYHIKYEVDKKDKNGKIVYKKDGKSEKKIVPINATEFFLSPEDQPTHNLNSQSFAKSIDYADLKRIKKSFNKDGFCTYQDAEHLCYKVLNSNPQKLKSLAKRFPIVFIDECQDLSQNQLRTFHLLIKSGVKVFLIGDLNQGIYEFRRVDISKIICFINYDKFLRKELSENFRSNQKIVNVAMNLEEYNTNKKSNLIKGNEKELLEKSCILWEYNKNEFYLLPQRFIDKINDCNKVLEKKKASIQINRSTILARAYTTLAGFKNQPNSNLNKIELFANSLACWANSPRTGNDLQNALQQLGKSICLLAYNGKGNHQSQYCPEYYTPVEWRYQLWDLIEKAITYSTGLYPFDSQIWKNWVKKLKIFLEEYWKNFRSPENAWPSVKSKINSPDKKGDVLIAKSFNIINNSNSDKIRMTTFHDVKGETLDAVMVVSSPNKLSKGGHYEHWLTEEESLKEYVRFAYVASSRPKHLLIWAIPKKENNSFVDKIKELGFESE